MVTLEEEIKSAVKRTTALSVKTRQERYPLLDEELISFESKLTFKPINPKHLLYCYVNNITSTPLCKHCKSGEVIYKNFNKGYSEYCSFKCLKESNSNLEKRKKTNKEKYGVELPFQSKDIQNKIKKEFKKKHGVEKPFQLKSIQTKVKNKIREKYKVDNISQSEEIKEKKRLKSLEKYKTDYPLQSKEVINKRKETNKGKYGFENPVQSNEVKEKIKNTCLEKYNSTCVLTSEKVKNKRKEKFKKEVIGRFPTLQFIQIDSICKVKCLKCDNKFESPRMFLEQRVYLNSEPCIHCNPIGFSKISKGQQEILDFIKSNYKGKIESNSRVLKSLELDIYLPELNLAIEYNGLYWHSEAIIANNHHLRKYNLCKEKGIKLIQIFEDDWLYKKEIVKSRLLNLLNIKSNSIYARNCNVKVIDNKEIRDFLNSNHLQGYVAAKISLGLYHKGELVSVMTFGNKRRLMNSISKENCYELLRFCNKTNFQVTGAAGKLFNYFIKNYKPKDIISYANKCWSDDKSNVYVNLGFQKENDTVPGYHYVIGDKRVHRYGFRKDILIKQGYDKLKSEHQIMLERKIYRIYDCGSIKYIYKCKDS